MREFSWNLFLQTGNVHAYLLYKQIQNQQQTRRSIILKQKGS